MALPQRELRELALFAGAGGGILGGLLLGWRTVCAVEIDPYCRRVLLARQRDRILPRFPIWDDVRTFDGRPWRGRVDVISGGFPCQDISAAGKGGGLGPGTRSGLWVEMARIIGEVRPVYVLVENSPMLLTRGLGVVLGGLAALGYDARWGILGAADAGAPHLRARIWILANSSGQRCRSRRTRRSDPGATRQSEYPFQDVADAAGAGLQGLQHAQRGEHLQPSPGGSRGQWETEPALDRVAYGGPHRVDRIRALGNAQVPQCMALAWETLRGGDS